MYCNVRNVKAKQLRDVQDAPTGFPNTWDGSTSLVGTVKTVGSSHVTTANEQLYEDGIKLLWRDMELDSTLLNRRVQEQVYKVNRHLDQLCATTLQSGFTTGTVDNGAAGTTAAFSAGHTLNDSTTQSNLITAALSAAALSTARQRRREWRDYNSNALGLQDINLCLCVAPQNGDLARVLTGSQVTTVNTTVIGGSSASDVQWQSNPNAAPSVTVCENPYLAGDADDWWLCGTGDYSQCVLWVEEPDFKIFDQELDRATFLTCVYNAKCFLRPPAWDVTVGSNVA